MKDVSLDDWEVVLEKNKSLKFDVLEKKSILIDDSLFSIFRDNSQGLYEEIFNITMSISKHVILNKLFRKEFVKRAAGEGEQSKVAIRNIRRDAIEQIKKLQKDGLSEDAAKDAEKVIQDITDKFIALVEKNLATKEKEMMAI